MPDDDARRWFAVQVAHRHEKKVATILAYTYSHTKVISSSFHTHSDSKMVGPIAAVQRINSCGSHQVNITYIAKLCFETVERKNHCL